MIDKFRQIPLPPLPEYSSKEMQLRSQIFFENLSTRRTIRDFPDKPVDREVIENCIKTAGTAPSGANMQPWHFVLISDPTIKKQIRVAAEKEEKEFYEKRAPKEWLEALAPLGTDNNKPYLETAPYLIAIFMQFSMTSLSTGISEKSRMVRRVDRFSKKIRDRSCISSGEYSARLGRGICWIFFIGYYLSSNMLIVFLNNFVYIIIFMNIF